MVYVITNSIKCVLFHVLACRWSQDIDRCELREGIHCELIPKKLSTLTNISIHTLVMNAFIVIFYFLYVTHTQAEASGIDVPLSSRHSSWSLDSLPEGDLGELSPLRNGDMQFHAMCRV